MFKTKDTSRVTYFLFIVTMLNNFFWFIYGFIVSAYPIIIPNGISFVVNMIYLIWFILFLKFSLTNRLLMILGLAIIVTIGFFVGIYFLDSWDKKVFGIITIIVNCLLFIGPIQKMVNAFLELDRTYIPIEIVIAFILNSSIWIAYGVCFNNDINIILPNAFGLVLMVFEFCVWCYFYFNKDLVYNKNTEDDMKYNDESNEDENDDTNHTENQPFII